MAATAKPVTPDEFSGLMVALNLFLSPTTPVAVAVSGGGDSMALTLLLAEWCAAQKIPLTAMTVDHGLRSESADEAKNVARILTARNVNHKILTWTGEKPKTRIQETARAKRYALMAAFCRSKKIGHLFLAHNIEDQAETVLFRLAKGSGILGLGGIRAVTPYEEGLSLCRPLLTISHQRLLATCRAHDCEWIEDPSNQNNRYARVRIRNSFGVLEKEGLSAERLATLAARSDRLTSFVNQVVEGEYKNIATHVDTKRIEINYSNLADLPEEVVVGIILRAIGAIAPEKAEKVRLEELERLAARMMPPSIFKGATLGGCIFRKSNGLLIVAKEVSG